MIIHNWNDSGVLDFGEEGSVRTQKKVRKAEEIFDA